MIPLSNALHFKKCNLQDAKLLHEIYIQSYNEHYTAIWEDHGQAYLEKYFQLSAFELSINNPENHYYMIYQGAEPIGFFKLTGKELLGYHPNECLEINKIYILNGATGKGIGSKALKYINNLARSLNRNIIWLNVMEKGKARAFYDRHGFERIDQVDLDFPKMKPGLNVLFTYKKDLTKF